jgi:hypothetical protein
MLKFRLSEENVNQVIGNLGVSLFQPNELKIFDNYIDKGTDEYTASVRTVNKFKSITEKNDDGAQYVEVIFDTGYILQINFGNLVMIDGDQKVIVSDDKIGGVVCTTIIYLK